MNRLQKKCIIASTGLHLLLALVLFSGLGFLSSNSKPAVFELIAVDVTPDILSDKPGNNPGGASVRVPPRPAPEPPPAATPSASERVATPEPVKPPETIATDPTPIRRHEVKPNLTPVVRRQPKPSKPSDRETNNMNEQAERVGEVVDRLRTGLTSTTPISVNPGTGTGAGTGQSYANYRDFVGSKYWDAWIPPENATLESAVVMAKVTIARNGKVIKASITQRSGDAEVDASVQRTLDRVTEIAPFPEGATEPTRTYPISFDLKTKRQTG